MTNSRTDRSIKFMGELGGPTAGVVEAAIPISAQDRDTSPMKLDTRHKIYGHTIAEHIETVSGELDVDAVGLWQIVPAGREGFRLENAELTEFVRQCILALLASGAKPVKGGGGTRFDWILQTHYGESDLEIANSIVGEWLEIGAGDVSPGGVWFALPSPSVGFS